MAYDNKISKSYMRKVVKLVDFHTDVSNNHTTFALTTKGMSIL